LKWNKPRKDVLRVHTSEEMIMAEYALQVNQLTKTFTKKHWFSSAKSSTTAVDNISFTLEQGEILGFLGANGSGKTTTIQMLLGVMTPTSGNILYFGQNLSAHRSNILQNVAFASSYTKLPSRLTIAENLDFFGRLYGLSRPQIKERMEYLLKFFSMWHMKDASTGVLSAGQMTRVMLSKAFMASPKVVLLDEPTASLDPDVAYDVHRFVLHQQKQEGVSVLFTSHNMNEVTEICSRVLILQSGKIVANDTPEKLARSVSTAHVSLIVGDGLKRTEEYAKQHNIPYEIKGRLIELNIEENHIARLLTDLARINVEYTNISIEKPTLEDYFLHLVRNKPA